MSQSLSPSPAATRLPARSARQGHVGPAGRCAGGAASAPSGAAPFPVSSPAAWKPQEKKAGTAGYTPGERGYPPLPEAPLASAVLTIVGGRAAFRCLSVPPGVAEQCPLFRLRGVGGTGKGQGQS
ncbi:hypothetical protein [Sphingobium sp. B2]|uniref:hypothetical protein n=1 Tax=Sphingobium sp. B2 TaxID=2583228 RepID=UPI0011A335E2|nr:hypothetical protein [Sphingobium sp. B2]